MECIPDPEFIAHLQKVSLKNHIMKASFNEPKVALLWDHARERFLLFMFLRVYQTLLKTIKRTVL